MIVSLLVPLGDAQGRMRGERQGTWRRAWRKVYDVRGTLGRRTGEVIWRRLPFVVRERGAGHWAITFAPRTLERLVRLPPAPGQQRGRWHAFSVYPVRRRVGIRRAVFGYVVWRGRIHRVETRGRGLELVPRRGKLQ